MKSLKEYIVNNRINKFSEYKYHPKTKDELIENIKTELEANNEDLNCIDTSEIKDMSYLFNYLHGVNISNYNNIDISQWDVSNVYRMDNMFSNCNNFNSDISKWDVSNVSDMAYMFFECHNFNFDISNWDVSRVTDMRSMFEDCETFNCDLSKWDVRKVIYMKRMFFGCKNFNRDLSKWNLNSVGSVYTDDSIDGVDAMFDNSGLEKIYKSTPTIHNGKFVRKSGFFKNFFKK